MLSFWEHDVWLDYDYIVVGAGIIGLSTAIALKEHAPAASVLVLERGLFPTGASTKNAGFACFGSLTEICADIRINGAESTAALVEQRVRGLSLLRKRLGEAAIGFEQHGGYELLFEQSTTLHEDISSVNTLLHDIFGQQTFELRNKHIATFGFNTSSVKALVYSPFEGQIHTGTMMQALMRLAAEKGVMVLTGAFVEHVQEERGGVTCVVQQNHDMVRFRAHQVALCTNAFTADFLPNEPVQAGRGQVLITKPLSHVPFKGVFHFDEGFYYFRNVETPSGHRVLFGGGRNMDFASESTTIFELNNAIQHRLETLLSEVILPTVPFEIEHRWAGIMGFHATKLPQVRRVGERITLGFGCNGMGVALGSLIGDETARMLIESSCS